MAKGPTSICLSMIVKNEARVIARCLRSVLPLLSSWVIVDTGSTDGTQEIVREVMKDLPGELYERPWRDFASNRNEALELAEGRADYLLVIDADDTLSFSPDLTVPPLTENEYSLLVQYGSMSHWRSHLFRADAGFHYVGVVHEVVVGGKGVPATRLPGITYHCTTEGARSADPEKYRKDAAALTAALEKEPGNARYTFYLAQSHRDAGEPEKAIEVYERRVAMGGWAEEVWYSLYQVAMLTMRLERPAPEVIAAFLRAYEYRPSRAEAFYQLAAYLRNKGRLAAAYPFAKVASETPRPGDALFIDDGVYTWCALDELAVAAYWTDHPTEALEASERLLANPAVPAGHRDRIQKNAEFSRAKIGRG